MNSQKEENESHTKLFKILDKIDELEKITVDLRLEIQNLGLAENWGKDKGAPVQREDSGQGSQDSSSVYSEGKKWF